MRKRLNRIYRFLPVQLFLLHFRKSQQLLIFWVIIVFTIINQFAQSFGAYTLFLSPEYLGQTSFISMMLTGAAFGMYIMSWHITTFIIHSGKLPMLGATRQGFLK